MSDAIENLGPSVDRMGSTSWIDGDSQSRHAANMLYIPAGSFAMGSDEGSESEQPIHDVFVDGFWIDKVPVTNGQFSEFIAATGYTTDVERAGAAWGYDGTNFGLIPQISWASFATNRSNHPVVLVSWFDATAFAEWAGKRLPTEAEWERAARGSLEGKLYPWGDDVPDGTQSNFGKSPAIVPSTTEVREFAPNGFGLFDMVGNVWQWCSDWFESSYHSVATTDPAGAAAKGTHRVRRGGGWNVIQPFRLRCSNRGAYAPSGTAPNLGFRCAEDAKCI